MIKIRNGKQVILVPQSAYEKIYKPAGWTPITTKGAKKSKVDTPVRDTSRLLQEVDSLTTLEELKTFANSHRINVEGITTRRDMKIAIREALEQES